MCLNVKQCAKELGWGQRLNTYLDLEQMTASVHVSVPSKNDCLPTVVTN